MVMSSILKLKVHGVQLEHEVEDAEHGCSIGTLFIAHSGHMTFA